MQLSFHDIYTVEFSFSQKQDEIEDSLSVGYDAVYSEEDPKRFAVKFSLKIRFSKTKSVLDALIFARFSTDKDIDEEFRKSSFPVMNAPAIAYPFVRAFIHNFLLNSGHPIIIMPSINFSQRYKEHTGEAGPPEEEEQI